MTARAPLKTRSRLIADHTAHKSLEELEHDHIVATREQVHWQVEGEGGAAEVLGINGSTLRSRMGKHGIRRPGSRPPGAGLRHA